MEAKQRLINAVRTWCEQTGEFPPQEDPDIQQEQTDAEQEKTQGWIAGGRGGAHASGHSIRTFDTEPASIFLVDLLDPPVEANHNERQPFAPSFAGLFGDERSFQGQDGLRAIGESMNRPVAGWAMAQGPNALCFASDRASQDGRLLPFLQKAKDRRRGKPLVQVEYFARKTQHFQAFQQKLERFQGGFPGQDEAYGQGQADLPPNYIDRGDPHRIEEIDDQRKSLLSKI